MTQASDDQIRKTIETGAQKLMARSEQIAAFQTISDEAGEIVELVPDADLRAIVAALAYRHGLISDAYVKRALRGEGREPRLAQRIIDAAMEIGDGE